MLDEQRNIFIMISHDQRLSLIFARILQ